MPHNNYHYVLLPLEKKLRPNLKEKYLVVQTKQEAVHDNDIKILVLKTPQTRLVHIIYCLVTVLLRLRNCETNGL